LSAQAEPSHQTAPPEPQPPVVDRYARYLAGPTAYCA
jgi:hypothetical protein